MRWWHRSPWHEAEYPRPPASRQGAAILAMQTRLLRAITVLPRPLVHRGTVGVFRIPVAPAPVAVWAPRGYQGEAFLRLGIEIAKAHPSGLPHDAPLTREAAEERPRGR